MNLRTSRIPVHAILLISAAIPWYLSYRRSADEAARCVTNLCLIKKLAEAYYSMENRKSPESIEQLIRWYPYATELPQCPSGGTYSFTPVTNAGTKVTCSCPDPRHSL